MFPSPSATKHFAGAELLRECAPRASMVALQLEDGVYDAPCTSSAGETCFYGRCLMMKALEAISFQR